MLKQRTNALSTNTSCLLELKKLHYRLMIQMRVAIKLNTVNACTLIEFEEVDWEFSYTPERLSSGGRFSVIN